MENLKDPKKNFRKITQLNHKTLKKQSHEVKKELLEVTKEFRANLRRRKIRYSFIYPIGFYLVTFAFPDKMLILEVVEDKYSSRDRDLKRSAWLKKFGFREMTLRKSELQNFDIKTISNLPSRSIKEFTQSVLTAAEERNFLNKKSPLSGEIPSVINPKIKIIKKGDIQ